VKEDGHAVVKLGDDLVRIAGDDGEGFEHRRSWIGIWIWSAFLILLLWSDRKESVPLILNAGMFLPAAVCCLLETHSDCGRLFNPLFPDAGEAEGFARLEPNGVRLSHTLFELPPFIKTVDRNHAATAPDRICEGPGHKN
jgi:hypothetical protein